MVNKKQKREKIGRTPLDPTKPLGDKNPPIETQFKPGNTVSVGKGRPRKLPEFRELILDILAEESQDKKSTRAIELVRSMLVKSPKDRVALLEYAFGKVPTPVTVEPSEALQKALDKLGLTLEDVKSDPLAVNLFAQAGVRVDVGTPETGSDSGE